jgi:hypothetical protein
MSNNLISIELLIRELEKLKEQSEWAPIPLHLELDLPQKHEKTDEIDENDNKTVIIIDI